MSISLHMSLLPFQVTPSNVSADEHTQAALVTSAHLRPPSEVGSRPNQRRHRRVPDLRLSLLTVTHDRATHSSSLVRAAVRQIASVTFPIEAPSGRLLYALA